MFVLSILRPYTFSRCFRKFQSSAGLKDCFRCPKINNGARHATTSEAETQSWPGSPAIFVASPLSVRFQLSYPSASPAKWTFVA